MHDDTRSLRKAVAVVLLLGMLGLGAELLFIEHIEGWQQVAPVAALALGIGTLAWDAAAKSGGSRLALRLAMLGLLVSGVAGVYLHYDSNAAFQRELDPSLGTWPLILKTLRAHSPPSLAPAAMGLLGALGWIVTAGRTPSLETPPR